MPEMNGDSRLLPARVEEVAPPQAARVSLPSPGLEQSSVAAPRLDEYLSIFARRKWTILVAFAVVFFGALAVTALTPRVYEATATLLISDQPERSPESLSKLSPAYMSAMGSSNLDTHVQLIEGESTAIHTATRLQQGDGPALSVREIHKRVQAKAVRNTQLIRISARADNSGAAEKIANATAGAYVEMNRGRAQGYSETTSDFLSQQLAIARHKLTQAEDALRNFKEETGTVGADAAAAELVARSASLRSEADKTGANLAQARERLAKLRVQLSQQNQNIKTGQVRDDATVLQLRGRLAELEGKRLAAQAKYTSAYAAPVAKLDEEIGLIRSQLNEEVGRLVRGTGGDLTIQKALTVDLLHSEAEVAALEARDRQMRRALSQANQELGKVPSLQLRLAGLQRQLDVTQTVHSDLLRRSQEVEVGRIMALGNADIVEPASKPLAPVKPNVLMNLALGLLLGLTIGIGVAFMRDQLDNTVRDQAEFARLTSAPVLGAIPVFRGPHQPVMLSDDLTHGLALEAYRTLRYCLEFATPGGKGRVILVSSPSTLEGKTTTVLNLARTTARAGKRVVLVDADLRRSGLRRALSTGKIKGVSDFLSGNADLREILQEYVNLGLTFVDAGRHVPNPMELLDSAPMRALIEQLREEADLVILDSPPLLAVADSLVLARLSDAVLLVCVPGKSNRYDLQLARQLLSQVGEKISGVVLNKVNERQGYGYRSRYHYPYDRKDENSGA